MTTRSQIFQIGGLLSMLAALGCITLISHSRPQRASSLLAVLPDGEVVEEVPMQALAYIPRPDPADPKDYYDFLQMCTSACEIGHIYDVSVKCSAEALGPKWVTYVDECKDDPCACKILMMYCGGVYKTQIHPQYAAPGVCR
mmetsp:Transcript_59051/g.120997  ORF Transcript_59051/g.120997 Transcript_59051/m.120997 type:complete len:142 (-) Transcript_59051:226-651(-)